MPFEFIVAGVHMPAGNYQVTQLDGQSIVSVKSMDGRHFAYVLTNALAPEQAGPSPSWCSTASTAPIFSRASSATESDGREIPLPAKLLKSEPTRVAVLAFPAKRSAGH